MKKSVWMLIMFSLVLSGCTATIDLKDYELVEYDQDQNPTGQYYKFLKQGWRQ